MFLSDTHTLSKLGWILPSLYIHMYKCHINNYRNGNPVIESNKYCERRMLYPASLSKQARMTSCNLKHTLFTESTYFEALPLQMGIELHKNNALLYQFLVS